ncbi:MAG: LysR family transcriptional regulator [Planctomycetota bacterium]|nr:LysR family transcriptional regulator [Planctomycetota bacterium]
MSFRNFELFCEVAECCSFSKAADRRGVSQSCVSQAVAHIEKQLSVELINRSHRPLALTPAGQRYFEGCRELLTGFERLENEVRQLAGRVTGRLRVAAIYSVGLLQMDSYVHYFEEAFPDVDVRVEYAHPERVYERVRSNSAEIGLLSFPEESSDIAAIPWQEQQFSLIVHPDHLLAKRVADGYDSAPVEVLEGEDYVNFTSELRVRKQLDLWLREAGVSPNVIHEFDNVEQIRRAVEDGVGVALLPEATVARSLEIGTLVSLRLENVEWFRPLGVIHKRNRRLSNAADRFVELLHDDLSSLRDAQQPFRTNRAGNRDQELNSST